MSTRPDLPGRPTSCTNAMNTPRKKIASRSFRLVCPEHRTPLVEELLAAQGFRFRPEPFSPLARGLTHAPFALGSSLAAFFGLIYIQDRSSMLPPVLLDPPPGSPVLDLCASPGSKTGFLAQLVGPGGLVLGNEVNPSRLSTLRANLRTLNLLNTATTGYPAQDLPLEDGSWPLIVLDAPCSGWGTLDKNPQALKLWSGEKTAPLVALQKELLARAARLLAPGGRLMYSTCTTNPEENELQVRWAEEHLGLTRLPLDPVPGFSFCDPASPEMEGTLLVDGTRSDAQGFFTACLTRTGPQTETERSVMADLPGNPVSVDEIDPDHLLNRDVLARGELRVFSDQVIFLPRQARDRFPETLRWQGTRIGSLKKDRFHVDPRMHCLVPGAGQGAHGLHLHEVEDLTRLLSGQSLPAPGKGRTIPLYWRELPLGWVKIKGKRVVWSDR